MAKVTIVGNNLLVTSAFSMDDLKLLESCCSDALQLTTEVDGKRVPVFAVSTGDNGSLSNYGVTFNTQSHGEYKRAAVTIPLPPMLENAPEYVAKTYSPCFVQLEHLENILKDRLETVLKTQQEVLENITVL